MNTSNIPFSTLSIESTLDLAIKCSTLIKERHPGETSLEQALVQLADAEQTATQAIARSRKKAFTEEVNKADEKRGRLFIGFRKMVEGSQYYELDDAVKNAADSVLVIIRIHGTQLHLEAMSRQSVLLTSLFEDLEAETAQAAIATMGLVAWVDGLKQAQKEFAELVQKRNELEVNTYIATKQEARTKLVDKLTNVLKGLDFLHSIQPATYEETVQLVTNLTSDTITGERLRQ